MGPLSSRRYLVSGGAGTRASGEHLHVSGIESANEDAVPFTDHLNSQLPGSKGDKKPVMRVFKVASRCASTFMQPREKATAQEGSS